MPLFLTYAKLSVLNFFILLKNICEKVNFSKNLKNRHFWLVLRHLGALIKTCATLIKIRQKL